MSRLPDPYRYLLGGDPPDWRVPGRVAALLCRLALDDLRVANRGADFQFDECLLAGREAAVRYAQWSAASGRKQLPQTRLVPPSGAHGGFLSAVQVAERLGCKARNVRDLHQRGRITAEKIGGRLLFPVEAVDGYIAQRRERRKR